LHAISSAGELPLLSGIVPERRSAGGFVFVDVESVDELSTGLFLDGDPRFASDDDVGGGEDGFGRFSD
jgi:hypothetical protein